MIRPDGSHLRTLTFFPRLLHTTPDLAERVPANSAYAHVSPKSEPCMSTKDSQDVPSPEVDGESNNVSCIPPHPVIPNTGYSLEDSEIVEGHPSGIHADARPPMSPQKPDRPELLHASGQVSASIPTSSPIELVGALTYTDEPSNALSLSCHVFPGRLSYFLSFLGPSDEGGPGPRKIPRIGSPRLGCHSRIPRRMWSLSGHHLHNLYRPPAATP